MEEKTPQIVTESKGGSVHGQPTSDRSIQVIELHMMDQTKYYPLALLSGTTIRTVLYPVSLVKTRLQIQNKKTLYNGTWDAFKKISHLEGIQGLYRGYLVSCLFIVPQMAYISVYEGCRQKLADRGVESTKVKSFIAGGCASIVGQTITVPIDIVNQHMQVIGGKTSKSSQESSKNKVSVKPSHSHLNTLNIETSKSGSRRGMTWRVIQAVYLKHGVRGFYKGYFTSLLVYTPHSAMWWTLYDKYCELLASVAPLWVPRLALQCIAAPLGGITAAMITNPLDVSRARIQVSGTGTLYSTLSELWKYEGMGLFTKAITARMTQSAMFSFSIILGYETVKRWSLLEEHKDEVRW